MSINLKLSGCSTPHLLNLMRQINAELERREQNEPASVERGLMAELEKFKRGRESVNEYR